MLTYNLLERGNIPLYQYLYQCIKRDIISGKLEADTALPSKRNLSSHLKVSINTVQSAYEQLVSEGYIYTHTRSGYYVSPNEHKPVITNNPYKSLSGEKEDCFFSFYESRTSAESFPYSVWARQLREVLSEKDPALFSRQSFLGGYSLRLAISRYLMEFRDMNVSPEQIIIGAGTEYLYSVILGILGKSKVYGIEDPGYGRIHNIYHSNGVKCIHLPMDNEGLSIELLIKSDAEIIHISPSHHFPTGVITPINRRKELIKWVNMVHGRYIIEDDYDSEFRFDGKPIPPMQSIDQNEKVIYMNTFSKTISPAIRISFAVLPPHLMQVAHREYGFSSCPVSSFEQHTLAKFIDKGYFERHINRMKRVYKNSRNIIIEKISEAFGEEEVSIFEENSGLHFLLQLSTDKPDKLIKQMAMKQGIKLSFLSEYYYNPQNCSSGLLVINYAGMDIDKLTEALAILLEILKQ